MRSFQKKLVATAASAALVAIVGAAWAQGDANVAGRDNPNNNNNPTAANSAIGASTNPSNVVTVDKVPMHRSATTSTGSSLNAAPATTIDNSSTSTSGSNLNNGAMSNTDNSLSSTDTSAPAPRSDRN